MNRSAMRGGVSHVTTTSMGWRWKSSSATTRRSHCNTLQRTARHCKTLQHTATHCRTRVQESRTRGHTAATYLTHATEFNILHHTACLQHIAAHYNTLQHTAPHCNTLQHTAAQKFQRHDSNVTCRLYLDMDSHPWRRASCCMLTWTCHVPRVCCRSRACCMLTWTSASSRPPGTALCVSTMTWTMMRSVRHD